MSDFSFFPLRPFFCAALAKRWKVKFRQGFAYFINNLDSKRHIIIRTAILYNEFNSGQIMKKTLYIYIYIVYISKFGIYSSHRYICKILEFNVMKKNVIFMTEQKVKNHYI